MPFHICRFGNLSEGPLNLLYPPPDIDFTTLPGLNEGLSQHGKEWLLTPHHPAHYTSLSIELIFEIVRQQAFPTRPSRMQSLFAVPSLEEAYNMAKKLLERDQEATIYEVQETISGATFEADMDWLRIEPSGFQTLTAAHAYWRGEPKSSNPTWELLIPQKVEILRCIGTLSFVMQHVRPQT